MTEGKMEEGLADSMSSLLHEIVSRLVEAAHPVKITLFGSYARGNITKHSDLDPLVILPVVTDRYAEMIRLREVLADILFPIDVLVYSEDEVQERGHLRGTTLYHALREGRVLHAA